MLVSHDGGNLSDLFHEVHNHWVTIPIIVYRVFFNVFGVRYLPFLVLVVLAHLAIGVLLRVIMRRVGVGPWIATAVASMFLLLGASGWNNIVWAFQITFDGSVLFGLGMLLSTDHDGSFGRGDAIGMVCGLAALMCSAVGVAMVVIAGVAVLIRRGWRLALVLTVPLGVVFLTWYFSLHRRSYRDSGGPFSVTDVVQFMERGLTHTLTRDVRFTGGMLLLLAILVAGLVIAWTKMPRDEIRQRAAMPAAMLFGAAIFLFIVGAGRGPSLTPQFATTTRFVHITTVLIAPALAVAADAIARRWPVTLPVLCVLFVVGAPANLADLRRAVPTGNHDLVAAIAGTPGLDRVPSNLRPLSDYLGESGITVGWLRKRVASGQFDPAHDVPPDLAAEALRRVGLRVVSSPRPAACRPFRPGTRHMEAGDVINFRGALIAQVRSAQGGTSDVFGFAKTEGGQLQALLGPMDVQLGPYTAGALECESSSTR
jgi:hypothetical protein